MINVIKALAGSRVNTFSVASNVFDDNFINSVVYSNETGYNVRSAFSEWRFNYSGTYLGLKVKPEMYASFPLYSTIQIIINGSYYQSVQFTDESLIELTLPAGGKVISLIEGALNYSSGWKGTFLTEIWLSRNVFSKNIPTPTQKIVFLGDSITSGFKPTNPQEGTYSRLFSSDGGFSVAVLGWGNGKLEDYAGTSGLITSTVSNITSLFSGVTTKSMFILVGTNDWAVATPYTTFIGWYEDLLDAINLADSSITINCISPLARSGDNSALDDYRTAIDTMCSTRSFATHIAGKTILIYPDDFEDIVHPSNSGHLKLYNAIK